MKNLLTLLFLVILSAGFSQKSANTSSKTAPSKTAANYKWDNANYAMTYEEFCTITEVNQLIDFSTINYPLLQACVFFETNQQRILNDVAPLSFSNELQTAAAGHANDMTTYNFFSHTSVVSGKASLSDRIKLAGLEPSGCGENIAKTFGLDYAANTPVYTPDVNNGFFSYEYLGEPLKAHTYLSFAKSVVQQWMDSSGHRANILSESYHSLGIGCSHYYNKSFYNMNMFNAVQVFRY